MDVDFFIKSYYKETEFYDFLLATFRPLKIEIYTGTYSSEYTIRIFGAEPVAPSFLEKEIRQWHERKKSKFAPSLEAFRITKIEYTAQEKKKLESIITYGNLFPPKESK